MKKMIGFAVVVLVVAGSCFAAFDTLNTQDATKTGLDSMATKINANFAKLPANAILTNVTAQTATITAGVTPQTVTATAAVTKQTAAITAAATVQGVTLSLKGIDDSTNSVVNVTNVVVTISNGDAVVTNLTVAITPNLMTNAAVSVSGVTTNVATSGKTP